jgi:hypothetical protein
MGGQRGRRGEHREDEETAAAKQHMHSSRRGD